MGCMTRLRKGERRPEPVMASRYIALRSFLACLKRAERSAESWAWQWALA